MFRLNEDALNPSPLHKNPFFCRSTVSLNRKLTFIIRKHGISYSPLTGLCLKQELKEEIASFEPTFKKAISISERLLSERLVDPERADSYENEINTLEKRWTKLQLKTMDNGTK